jgi:hypothetical protein
VKWTCKKNVQIMQDLFVWSIGKISERNIIYRRSL